MAIFNDFIQKEIPNNALMAGINDKFATTAKEK